MIGVKRRFFMFIKQIVVLKETSKDECRVALTPEAVSFLVSKCYRILIESDAGLNAGFKNSDYVKVGADIIPLTLVFPANTLILRVKRANKAWELEENKQFQENTAVFGFLDPLFLEADNVIAAWEEAKINTFSMGLMKRLSIHDPKNMQAAMSRIAGKLAFQDAKKRYMGKGPLKLTVIGTGPAGFSAATEARKEGIPVQLFGRQAHYRFNCESQGIIYHLLSASQNPARAIQPFLSEQNIVIAAARTIGEKAPVFIDAMNLSLLPKDSIVVDLAMSDGGNVESSKRDQTIHINGVSIVNISAYPKIVPKEASEAYSRCMVNLLSEVLTPKGELLFDHPLLQECWVTREGKRNLSLFEDFRKS